MEDCHKRRWTPNENAAFTECVRESGVLWDYAHGISPQLIAAKLKVVCEEAGRACGNLRTAEACRQHWEKYLKHQVMADQMAEEPSSPSEIVERPCATRGLARPIAPPTMNRKVVTRLATRFGAAIDDDIDEIDPSVAQYDLRADHRVETLATLDEAWQSASVARLPRNYPRLGSVLLPSFAQTTQDPPSQRLEFERINRVLNQFSKKRPLPA